MIIMIMIIIIIIIIIIVIRGTVLVGIIITIINA